MEKGFDEEWTERAIAANPEIGETNKEALERLGSVLDWLCLRVPKDDMPDTFVRLSEASKKQEESKTALVVNGANAVNAALVSDAPA